MRQAPEQSAGGYAWYLAALLALAHLLSFADRSLMSLLLEPMKADLRLSDAMLGVLQGTGFALFYGLAALPSGWLADRFNRRRLVIAAILLWSLATALCGLARTPAGLFFARASLGLAEAALVPAALSLLAAAFPPRQLGRAVALFTAGASLGRSGALAIGGAVLAALTLAGGLGGFAPWQGTFVVMAVPGVLLALAMLTIREPARDSVARPRVADAFAHIRVGPAAFVLHTGAATCVLLLVQALAAWAPAFYVRAFAMTPAEAGLAIGGVLLIAAPLGHLCGGALMDWLQARGIAAPAAPVMAAGLAGGLICVWLVVGVRDRNASLALLGLANFCATLGSPAALAGVQMLAPDRLRGGTSALFLAATTLVGIGIGVPLVGLAADLLGGSHHLGTALGLVVTAAAIVGIVAALASRAPFGRIAMSHSKPRPL